ncbi:helix-hairpin-helix domain-containing protein [Halorubrum trueperi]|uniref:Helix-hairpin-helix domain-containing protein n=1 Tax=Halorubrum trueperi TaxID=2004704 RepID=A0ABD5UEK1_9EURY
MPSDELTTTTEVVTLAEHADGLGTSTARRLENHGLETVADILNADEEMLTDVPYVSETRADTLQEIAEAVGGVDPDPLVDSRAVVLEATLGEKLNLTMAERDGYACPWYVIDAEDAIEWDGATGETWRTRRLRIADGISGTSRRECDLVLGGEEIRLEDPPVKHLSAQPNAPEWRVESVGAIGRASTSSIATLRGQQEQQDAKPEGDDTWRKYQRGETA